MKKAGTPKHKLVKWRHDRDQVTLWHYYDRLFIRDVLHYQSLKTKNRHPDPAVVVPKTLLSAILKSTYDSPFTGHLGVTRTLDRIRKRFFWSQMRKSIETYIRQCDTMC